MSQVLATAIEVEVERRGGRIVTDRYFNISVSKVGDWLVSPNNGLLLCGNVGAGKTTIMDAIKNLYAAFKTITVKGVNVGFKRLESIELYNLYSNDYKEFAAIKECPMLAIDDLGIEPVNVKIFGTDVSPISEIIYHRYERQFLTIITTNLSPQEIRARYGDRIADRFNEMMDVVIFSGVSYRKNNHQI